MSEWEPNEESVLQAYWLLHAGAVLTTESTSDAIKAAVAADPLLSSAEELRDALDALAKAVREIGGYKRGEIFMDDVLRPADAALAKSRGQQ